MLAGQRDVRLKSSDARQKLAESRWTLGRPSAFELCVGILLYASFSIICRVMDFAQNAFYLDYNCDCDRNESVI